MNNDVAKYLIANTIYGTISLFLHYVNAESEFVVLCRGVIGSIFIIFLMYVRKDLPNIKDIKKNLKYLLISGAALGLNWVALFAGYRYGSALTSLCNYTAPIFVTILNTLIYKEKMTLRQILFVLLAFIGIVLVSGVFDSTYNADYHCIVYGFIAAIGFTILVLVNRKIKAMKPLDQTVSQLLISAIFVLPFVIINNGFPQSLDIKSIILLTMLGVVHTGIAYIFYFNSIDVLPIYKVVILGYIEPVLAIITGVAVFGETITPLGAIGAVCIILAAVLSELSPK